jgi:hypothetical protein
MINQKKAMSPLTEGSTKKADLKQALRTRYLETNPNTEHQLIGIPGIMSIFNFVAACPAS